jgi:murein endopeptidase
MFKKTRQHGFIYRSLLGASLSLFVLQGCGSKSNSNSGDAQLAPPPVVFDSAAKPTLVIPETKPGEAAFEAPPESVTNNYNVNKPVTLALGKIRLTNARISYSSLDQKISVSGQAAIIDSNNKNLREKSFNLTGSHEGNKSSFKLYDGVADNQNEPAKMMKIRGQATCMQTFSDDSIDCSHVVVDIFISFNNQMYTEQIEVDNTLSAQNNPNANSPPQVGAPTNPTPDNGSLAGDEDDGTDTQKEDQDQGDTNLQPEGSDDSIAGRYEGPAETIDLDDLFADPGPSAPAPSISNDTSKPTQPPVAVAPPRATPPPAPVAPAPKPAPPKPTPQPPAPAPRPPAPAPAPRVPTPPPPRVVPQPTPPKPAPRPPAPTPVPAPRVPTPAPKPPKITAPPAPAPRVVPQPAPVLPPQQPLVIPRERPLSPDLVQTQDGRVRPVNQAIGYPDQGRLHNATSLLTKQQALGSRAFFEVVAPARKTYFATYEMSVMIERAGNLLNQRYSKKLFVSSAAAQNGGHLKPHASHQMGTDVDLGYPSDTPGMKFPLVVKKSTRAYYPKNYSPEKTYNVFKFMFSQRDIKVDRIFVDDKIKAALCAYAKSAHETTGADKDFVNKMFQSMQHVVGHGDHFHLRLHCSPSDNGCRSRVYRKMAGCQ